METQNSINNDAPAGADDLSAAFDAVSAEISALPEEELVPVTLDVLGAVSTVTGVLPRLRSMRPQLAEHLPRFDLARFDKLEQYAQALSLIQGVYRAATTPKADVAALGSELTLIRDRLYSSAVALVDCGLVDGARLESCRKQIGYRALAEDVFTLVAVFKDNWSVVQGRTAIDLGALGKWRTQAFELLEAVGLRDKAPVTGGEVALTRQKAFSLFVRTYDDARRAIGYLRGRAGDADDIAPSLYSSRGSSRRAGKDEATPVPAAPSSDTPAAEANAASPVQVENPLGLPITPAFPS